MATELDMLVVVVLDGGNGVQILAYKVAQNAVTRAMKDAHTTHTNQCGIVNKVHNSLDCLVTPHAANVNIGLESQFAVVNIVVSLLAHICCGADILNLYGLSRLQTVCLDRCLDKAECNGNIALVDRYNLANLGLTGQADRVTNLDGLTLALALALAAIRCVAFGA